MHFSGSYSNANSIVLGQTTTFTFETYLDGHLTIFNVWGSQSNNANAYGKHSNVLNIIRLPLDAHSNAQHSNIDISYSVYTNSLPQTIIVKLLPIFESWLSIV